MTHLSDSKTDKWPQDYALIQRQVDVAMKHGEKDCIGDECCDFGEDVFTCIRHSRTAELVGRYLRRKET